jgi:hypothetical protein
MNFQRGDVIQSLKFAEPGQLVRGVIIAREITEDLLLACALLPGVQLFEYELSLKLNRIAEKPLV